MEFYSEQACDGIELLDLLFDKNDGILCRENAARRDAHPWPIQDPNMLIPAQSTEDFFNTLLIGTESASPLWPSSPSDSGISEDPHSDRNDSPPPPGSPPLNSCYVSHPSTVLIHPDGWGGSGISPGKFARDVPPAERTTSFTLTIKDLLLSGAPEPSPLPSHQSCQDLVLNDDEKKLLVKEGVSLPSQLPLTKFEERILKKIRRKIRNKQSAQESRKKKKEYIDGLESRMAACTVENQELQKKVFHLEKCNISLMDQLRRLQALVMTGSNKPAQTGTCVLVLLLSFTLILLPSMKTFTQTKVSQSGDQLTHQSRSLHSLQSSRVMHALERPYTLAEESKSAPGFPDDEAVHDTRPLTAPGSTDYDVGSHNTSLDHPQDARDYRADPITGRVAKVTLRSRRDPEFRPHADDMLK